VALVFRNGRVYSYQTARVGGRVVRRYLGAGEFAILRDQLDKLIRVTRRSKDLRERADLEALDDIEQSLAGWVGVIDEFVESTLTRVGWHRPGRHSWRRRRHMSKQTPVPNANTATAKNHPARMTESQIRQLVESAREGDELAMRRRRRLLDEKEPPFGFEDAASEAENAVAQMMYPTDSVSQEAVRREIRSMTSRLSGPNPSPIEGLLARRAALCWVIVCRFETVFARAMKEGMTPARSEHYQRRIDRAHRRLLSALRTLASVRRVPLTAVQVNVQALNVATPTSAQ
jgi:hypothetical protein